ncbi:MAG: TnpV protein [Lachnospiraceae bacterium]|nr:TnpV protein [Lachnospiraceae bacterium]
MDSYIVEENGIGYILREDGFYYPDLKLSEGVQYEIGKYGMMRKGYLKKYRYGKYVKLLLDGKLNEHLYEIDEECYKRIDILMDKLRDELNITEELKETDQMQWVRNMNYVRGMAEENIIKEIVYM